jgi:hypothetical protein
MTTREGETMNADISETISRIARDGARPYQIAGIVKRLRELAHAIETEPSDAQVCMWVECLESEIAALEDV